MRFAAVLLLLSSPAGAALFWRPQPISLQVPAAAASAGAAVQSIGLVNGLYAINGVRATEIGSGDFKTALMHPSAPQLAVKVFQDRWANGVEEKGRELAQIALLPPSVVPRLVEHGTRDVNGKPTAYVVQERVSGYTLKTVTPTKLAEVKKLFDRLTKARLEIADSVAANKIRANIMVGETPSGGFGAYLVDPDVTRSDKSERELRAFYDGLLDKIVNDR